MNPVWHVHNSSVPKEKNDNEFFNVVESCWNSNANTKELLTNLLKNIKGYFRKRSPIFDNLVGYAIKYFNDVIKLRKNIKLQIKKKKTLEALVKTLESCNDKMTPEDIQTLIYTIGKENRW